MLRQQVERTIERITTLDGVGAHGIARSSDFYKFEGVRGHTHDARYTTGRVT